VAVVSGLWLFIRLCLPEIVREMAHEIASALGVDALTVEHVGVLVEG
jgi:hypothetical protein